MVDATAVGLARGLGDGKLEELDADIDHRVDRPDKVRCLHLDGVFRARQDPGRLHDLDRQPIDALRSEFLDPCGGGRPEVARQSGAQAEVYLIPGKKSAKATGVPSRVLGVHDG